MEVFECRWPSMGIHEKIPFHTPNIKHIKHQFYGFYGPQNVEIP